MNKKGFTLVEVILAIAIMALLVLILVPNVIALLNKNNVKSCNNLKSNIESAAKMYVTNNKYKLGFKCDTPKNITFKTLVDSGDLKLDSTGKLTNPIDKTVIDLEKNKVTVVYSCSNNTFTYTVNDIDCSK